LTPAGLPPPEFAHNTVNEPAVTVLTVGIFTPVAVLTGVIKIIEAAVQFELVIVVLLPVRAAYPIKPVLIPAEVTPSSVIPSQDGTLPDISTKD